MTFTAKLIIFKILRQQLNSFNWNRLNLFTGNIATFQMIFFCSAEQLKIINYQKKIVFKMF